jgi:hypothetical protein
MKSISIVVGQHSAVGIATRCGLDVPGIKSWWGKISATVQTGPEAQTSSYTKGNGGISEAKQPGGGADYLPQSSAEVKERVELQFYPPPTGPSWPLLWCTLPLPCSKYGDAGVYLNFTTVE